MLVEGTVDVRRAGRKVAELGGGSFFGEIALLTDAPRNATVTALTPTRVHVITGQAFQRVHNETTTIRPKVLAALVKLRSGTPEDLLPEAYADTPPMAWFLATRSALAHLEHLVELGQATREGEIFKAA